MKGLLRILVLAIVIIVPVALIALIVKRTKKSSKFMKTPPKEGPYIALKYMRDGSLLEDGKCGWLDVECEDGEVNTFELKFNKRSPAPMYIPLRTAKYRITYRTKSKAAMMAEGVLTTINESNGAMGAFANAVYSAGGLSGQLSSVVVDVGADFVMNLMCSTDGMQKSCQIIS